MFHKLLTVRAAAWLLLALAMVLGLFSLANGTYHFLPLTTSTYVAIPIGAVALAAVALFFTRGQGDRVRHPGDKAILVGSVLAIWFVCYFATGIFVTYVHNAVVSNLQGVLTNIVAFGLTAAAIEYARHRTMLLAGRRNALWFGVFVIIIFALPQMNFSHLADLHNAKDVIKLIVSDFIPALTSSALLTYLAVACGLPAQLTFRLGVVAMTILPPIIPKYDWYLLGASQVMLTIVMYLVINRTQQERHERSRRHHTKWAFDVMWTVFMVALILFMTGVFAYKPSAIMSNSMVPTFRRGCIVIVQKNVSPMDISIGDIIEYKGRDLVITHRVIAIDQATDGSGKRVFTTKGDNNPSADPEVNQDQVMGVIRAQIPYVGYPTVWLSELTIGNQSKQVNG